jgi:hypothetical protein
MQQQMVLGELGMEGRASSRCSNRECHPPPIAHSACCLHMLT